MDEKSEILDQLDQLDQLEAEASQLASRLHPYMVGSSPANETAATAQPARSPVYERIRGVISHLRELNARLVP